MQPAQNLPSLAPMLLVQDSCHTHSDDHKTWSRFPRATQKAASQERNIPRGISREVIAHFQSATPSGLVLSVSVWEKPTWRPESQITDGRDHDIHFR